MLNTPQAVPLICKASVVQILIMIISENCLQVMLLGSMKLSCVLNINV